MRKLSVIIIVLLTTLAVNAQTEVSDTVTADTEQSEVLVKKDFKPFKTAMLKATKKEHKGRNLELVGTVVMVVGAAVLLPELAIGGAVVYIVGYFIDKKGVRLRKDAMLLLPE